MKYIKKFENNVSYQHWIISLKMPDFLLSLKKIGFLEKDIIYWLNLFKNDTFTEGRKYPDRKTITISKNKNIGGFTWYWYPKRESDHLSEFMGEIVITPEEIQEYFNDIEIKKNVQKYNL